MSTSSYSCQALIAARLRLERTGNTQAQLHISIKRSSENALHSVVRNRGLSNFESHPGGGVCFSGVRQVLIHT
jgi:hypothetical protein